MAERLEDLNLPHASVLKIIKDALPENVNIGKDVKNALAKAASMFVLYITSQGTQVAQKSNRKTLIGQDVLDALEETEFDEFIEPLKEILNNFKDGKQKKGDADKKDEDTDDVEENEEEEDATTEDNEA